MRANMRDIIMVSSGRYTVAASAIYPVIELPPMEEILLKWWIAVMKRVHASLVLVIMVSLDPYWILVVESNPVGMPLIITAIFIPFLPLVWDNTRASLPRRTVALLGVFLRHATGRPHVIMLGLAIERIHNAAASSQKSRHHVMDTSRVTVLHLMVGTLGEYAMHAIPTPPVT